MSLLEGHDTIFLRHEEVAVVFVEDDGAPSAIREIVICPRGLPLRTISSISADLDPMVYPIFFPRGDAGWQVLDKNLVLTFVVRDFFSNMLSMHMLKLKDRVLL